MTALPPPIAEKCAKAIGQLSSPNEGTVMAGARGLVRILEGAGLQITDLMEHVAAPPRETVRFIERASSQQPPAYPFGSWRDAARQSRGSSAHRYLVVRCQNASAGRLNEWEAGFLLSLARQLECGRTLSVRQVGILDSIAEKLGVSS